MSNRPILPSVESVLKAQAIRPLISDWGRLAVTDGIRALQAKQRKSGTVVGWATDPNGYALPLLAWLKAHAQPGYRTVFNLTGTLLHTNLGRATINEALAKRALSSATRPTTLEYDVIRGKRGDREASIRDRLRRLTGAESATVVNNNAAALFITLNTLAYDRTVLVSRGELIEIGGSFRLPDIVAKSGVKMKEVGTTNRTHRADYSANIGSDTALLLKVHPSNYAIEGFTNEVRARSLAEIGAAAHVPVCVDLGSGALVTLSRFGLPNEPLPQQILADGVDLVTFSGDKLTGGPQAGIIVGNRVLIERIDSNPLKRVVRCDKITLSLLDETLKAYEDPDTVATRIGILGRFQLAESELRDRATKIHAQLASNLQSFQVKIVASKAQVGSGALPSKFIDSIAVQITHTDKARVLELDARMRGLVTPVIGRVHNDALLLDVRGAEPLEELLSNFDTLR